MLESLDHILCKKCKEPSPIQRTQHPLQERDDRDTNDAESRTLTVACPQCNHVDSYHEEELESLPSQEGLSPGQADASRHVFAWMLQCGRDGCTVPRRVFQVMDKRTSAEDLQSQPSLWIWEGRKCRTGEQHTFSLLPPGGQNQGPGPPKFDRRLAEKLKQAGFDSCDSRGLSELVHFTWNTLALTYPMECAFFRLVTVEGYTIDETVKEVHALVGEEHVGERMVRRHLQLVEDLFITVLEFYREAEIICPGSASRVSGCFHALVPDGDAVTPFHLKFLEVLLHAWAGIVDPISKITKLLRWGQPDAFKLAWPYKKETVPTAGSLIPGVLDILIAAATFVEDGRICRCMIALAHDKDLAKSWRNILEAVQPDSPAKAAHDKAKMVLFVEKSYRVCMAVLTVLARSYLLWNTVSARYPDLVDIPENERVEQCYKKFLGREAGKKVVNK